MSHKDWYLARAPALQHNATHALEVPGVVQVVHTENRISKPNGPMGQGTDKFHRMHMNSPYPDSGNVVWVLACCGSHSHGTCQDQPVVLCNQHVDMGQGCWIVSGKHPNLMIAHLSSILTHTHGQISPNIICGHPCLVCPSFLQLRSTCQHSATCCSWGLAESLEMAMWANGKPSINFLPERRMITLNWISKPVFRIRISSHFRITGNQETI